MPTTKTEFKEIRMRDVAPALFAELGKLQLEFRENTVTRTIAMLIPKFRNLQKVNHEQQNEIAKLVQELRKATMENNNLKHHYDQFISHVSRFSRETNEVLKIFVQNRKGFGTFKKRSKRPAADRKKVSRKVPTKKQRK